MELLNFIGGEFVASASKKTFVKKSPFDNSELANVASSDAMDVIMALQYSKKALQAVEAYTPEQRGQFLNSLADYLSANAESIAYQEALYQGLPQNFSLKHNIQVAIACLRKNAAEVLKPLPSGTYAHATGIVGIITSWTLSLRLVTERMAPALAAGNAVLIKISEHSPITGQILGEALKAAQIPPGLVQIIQGDAEPGKIIAGHPSIRAVTATGRQSTIESIAKVGLTQLKKLQLSGGAKNSAIVLADFDYKPHLSEILESFLIGQGQMCWNTARLFVLESFFKEFMEDLQAYVAALTPLTSPEGDSLWSPLISPDRVVTINEKIRFGLGEHGKVTGNSDTGGVGGNFIRPTFMVDLPNCSVMQQDELHGPLFLITPVKYQHEILKWANTSYLGHSAVVWGSSEKVLKVAGKLEAAQVWLNSWMSGPEEPIFGLKQSSYGMTDMSWAGSFYSDVKKLTCAR
ncbi:MAG: aldehyde dehydrogenase family protein [Bacillota bacterium]